MAPSYVRAFASNFWRTGMYEKMVDNEARWVIGKQRLIKKQNSFLEFGAES